MSWTVDFGFLQTLLKTVRTEMEAYRLYAVLPPCLRFLESLTNMYIRFNRRRLKGELEEEAEGPLNVLFHIILNFSLVMAPFACCSLKTFIDACCHTFLLPRMVVMFVPFISWIIPSLMKLC